MSVYSDPETGVYHDAASCAPRGHDRLLAAFAVEADLEPCGVCQPPEPDISESRSGGLTGDGDPAGVSRGELEVAMSMHDRVPEVAEELGISPSSTLELIGKFGKAHMIAPSAHDHDGRRRAVGDGGGRR